MKAIRRGVKPLHYQKFSSILRNEGMEAGIVFLDGLRMKGRDWREWFAHADKYVDPTMPKRPAYVFLEYAEGPEAESVSA